MITHASEATTTTSTSSAAMSFSTTSRYDGYLDRSVSHVVNEILINLLTFLDNYAKKMPGLISLVGTLRAAQFFAPSLLLCCPQIWDFTNPAFYALSWFSIVLHIIPQQYQEEAATYYLYIYSAITAIFFLLLVSLGFYHKQHGTVPMHLAQFLNLYNLTGGYLLMAPAEHSIGFLISQLISGER